jgi:hypothetical protein
MCAYAADSEDHLRVMFRFLFSGICRVTHDSSLEGHSLLVVIGPVGRGKRGIAAFEPIRPRKCGLRQSNNITSRVKKAVGKFEKLVTGQCLPPICLCLCIQPPLHLCFLLCVHLQCLKPILSATWYAQC